MISSIILREFGMTMPFTPSELERINAARASGQKQYYLDDNKAAITKLGTSKKPKLTSSPFTHMLEYGVNSEGYWNYDAMVLRLEDCIDYLKVLYPNFDYVFLFDHSNGHDRMQPGGLNAAKVGKNIGGKQSKMQDTVLIDASSFGPYHNISSKLQQGSMQTMSFTENDCGLFYMTPSERKRRRIDRKTGKKQRKMIKKKTSLNRWKK
jgi:hypothetical protein